MTNGRWLAANLFAQFDNLRNQLAAASASQTPPQSPPSPSASGDDAIQRLIACLSTLRFVDSQQLQLQPQTGFQRCRCCLCDAAANATATATDANNNTTTTTTEANDKLPLPRLSLSSKQLRQATETEVTLVSRATVADSRTTFTCRVVRTAYTTTPALAQPCSLKIARVSLRQRVRRVVTHSEESDLDDSDSTEFDEEDEVELLALKAKVAVIETALNDMIASRAAKINNNNKA